MNFLSCLIVDGKGGIKELQQPKIAEEGEILKLFAAILMKIKVDVKKTAALK